MDPTLAAWMHDIGAGKLVVRVPKDSVLMAGDTVWVSLGDKDEALRQILTAAANEGMAVVREDEQEGEKG